MFCENVQTCLVFPFSCGPCPMVILRRNLSLVSITEISRVMRYRTVSVMFISLTLTNVEFCMSRDFFPWILHGLCVDFAWVLRGSSVSFAWSIDMKRGTAQLYREKKRRKESCVRYQKSHARSRFPHSFHAQEKGT